MASGLSYYSWQLWFTLVMLLALHDSEGKEEDGCQKVVIINSVESVTYTTAKRACFQTNDPSGSMVRSCDENCTGIFTHVCIYDFWKGEEKLCPRSNGNCSHSDIRKMTMTNNTYNIRINERTLQRNITLGVIENWTLKPHSQNTGNEKFCSCNETSKAGSSKPIYPKDKCEITSPYDEQVCKGIEAKKGEYVLRVNQDSSESVTCVSCTNPVEKPEKDVSLSELDMKNPVGEDGKVDPATAAALMDNMTSVLNALGNATSASLTFGDIKGVISRVNKTKVSLAYNGQDMVHVSTVISPKPHLGWSVEIPSEAVTQAESVNSESAFVAIMRFSNMPVDANRPLLDAVYAIDMAANVSNLTDKIRIHFDNHKMKDASVSCNSWDGKGNWTEDGCTTIETDSTITCQCSHLTFFAILMSLPANGTISGSDLNSLTYISYIGCGLSLFFLGVALFMHFLLRKGKSSQSIQVLMNVFVALFLLNLTFLTNEWVANTGSYVGCIAIAVLMHYSMLATFTWFAMQALHLYLHLVMMADMRNYKHYMLKMCVPAWICPAVVVIVIACLGKYEAIGISADTGYQANMCWTKDMLVHYVVNIGYYAIVFLFSMGIFVVMVQRICAARKLQSKDVKQPSTSKNLSIIMSLLFLLGITWGVAFFSYGPMLIPSYYIFCILNSFQGLFLFIYYYNNSRDLPENLTSMKSSVSSDTAVSNVYSNTHG